MNSLPPSLKYAATHEWAALDNGVVRVGITDFAQEQLGDVMFVQLPTLGQSVQQGGVCASIESVKSASDLHSPVTGVIVAINNAISDAPELVNEDAYGAWLFSVQASDLRELDQLLTADAYRAQL